MFWITFVVACGWFSAVLRSADRTSSIIGWLLCTVCALTLIHPASPSHLLSLPHVYPRHTRLLIVDRSLVIPDLSGWPAAAICEMLIELYFAPRFVLIGNARIDWRRANGEGERLHLVLHATRQAEASFYCWIIYKTVWERIATASLEDGEGVMVKMCYWLFLIVISPQFYLI